MKIQLLIASTDNDYVEHISMVLAEKYADTFELSICSNKNSLLEQVGKRGFEAARPNYGEWNRTQIHSASSIAVGWTGRA